MKTILMMVVILISTATIAQKNNPYNQRGLDYKTSLGIISNDYNAGKVKEFDQATIEKYSKIIPLQTKTTVEMAAEILKVMKAPGFSFITIVRNSTLSQFSKDVYPRLLNFSKMPGDQFKNSLTGIVNEISSAKITSAEKELLLSMCAISYNFSESFLARGSGDAGCTVTGPDGTEVMTREGCIVASALAGAIIGFNVCGPWCALGGAVVGGIVAAVIS